MADTMLAGLEADLFAAFNNSSSNDVPMPDADSPVKTEHDQPPSQQASDAAPDKTAVPTPPPPPPPPPTVQQAVATTTATAPATSANPATPLISTAATVSSLPPPTTPAPVPSPATNQLAATPSPAPDAQSPSVQIEQLLASAQAQTDALVHQSPSQTLLPQSATPQATASSQTPTNPVPGTPAAVSMLNEPKRPRSPGLDDGDSLAKRLKMEFAQHEAQTGQTEQVGHSEVNGHDLMNFDLEAMLSSALAQYETKAGPEVNTAPPVNATPPTLELEKAQNKIADFSRHSLYHMRSMSLPTLGSFAVQILVRLSQNSKADTEMLLGQVESDFHKAYSMLRNVFESTRKMYSDSPLLSVEELEITDSEDRETIRMSNLASVAGIVFGASDVGLKDVHDSFFNIFIPEDGEYKDYLTELLVSLKTRLFLDALGQQPPQPALGVLDTLFPARFDEVLKNRNGDLALNLDEERLVGQIRERRELLVQSAADETIKKSLAEQSSPDRIAELLSLFLQSHLAVIVDYARNYGVNIPTQEEDPVLAPNTEVDEPHDSLAEALRLATAQLPTAGDNKDLHSEDLSGQNGDEMLKKLIEQELAKDSSLSHDLSALVKDPSAGQHEINSSSAELANLIAANLPKLPEEPPHDLPNVSPMMYSGAVGITNPGHATAHPHYLAQMNQQHQSQYQTHAQSPAPAAPAASGETNENGLPPNQSLPTAALYEKARQAAVAKSSNTARREGLHSTRRPWSPEEEKALMAGLDKVKGPHWSQILSLYGPHGSISNILRDRTQVQLKDKARNLKLFFLKTNSEMPYYLQHVTGELKTRAPSQAARKEAEEKARQNIQEEQAKLQGMMLLAGGLQDNNQPVMSSPQSTVPRVSPTSPGVSGAMNISATTASSGGLPPVPISPMVKSEPQEHHGLPKVTSFPSIAPAPAPSTSMQPSSKPQYHSLQPQTSSTQHHQPQQPQQSPAHQPQQHQAHQLQQQQNRKSPQQQAQSQQHIQQQSQQQVQQHGQQLGARQVQPQVHLPQQQQQQQQQPAQQYQSPQHHAQQHPARQYPAQHHQAQQHQAQPQPQTLQRQQVVQHQPSQQPQRPQQAQHQQAQQQQHAPTHHQGQQAPHQQQVQQNRPAQQQQQQSRQHQQVQQNQQAQQQHVQQAQPQQLHQQQHQQQHAQTSQPRQPQQQMHQPQHQVQQQANQQAQPQAQVHRHIPSPALPRPTQSAQASYQPQPQVSSTQPPPAQGSTSAIPGLPIPPNHHSTPDNQDQELLESLKAALAGPPN